MNTLDAGLQTFIDADSGAGGLAQLATGGSHQVNAPDAQTPPYIIFQEVGDDPLYALSALVADRHVYLVKGIAADIASNVPVSGQRRAGEIADRIKTRFTNAAITIAGGLVLYCRPLRASVPLAERDKSGRYLYHRGWLVLMWTA